jgi:hypothetical protein
VRLGESPSRYTKIATLPSHSYQRLSRYSFVHRPATASAAANKSLIKKRDIPAPDTLSAESDGLVKLLSTSGRKATGVTYDQDEQDGLRARSEQAIGELAQALIDNPTLHNAISAAFGAREKAMEAQQAAMSALNLPSATDVERLERRLRSVSQRLEDVEEQIDRVSRDLGAIRRKAAQNGKD